MLGFHDFMLKSHHPITSTLQLFYPFFSLLIIFSYANVCIFFKEICNFAQTNNLCYYTTNFLHLSFNV